MIVRSFTVAADSEPLSFSGRIRLRGKDELSLFPALFTLDLWNLPEEQYLRLFRCRQLSVSCGESCLVCGTVSDVYRRAVPEGVLTSVSVSLGLNLWETSVSLTVPAGTSVSETVKQILFASGTGIPLLNGPENDPVSLRPQSFFGRAAECAAEALAAVFARAMLTPSGMMIVPASGFPEPVQIGGNDLTDAPSFANGGRLAVLSCSVSGWRPGQTAEVSRKGTSFRGIIRSRGVDADTGNGPWKNELLIEVLK